MRREPNRYRVEAGNVGFGSCLRRRRTPDRCNQVLRVIEAPEPDGNEVLRLDPEDWNRLAALRFDGSISGPIGINAAAQIGMMPVGLRPGQTKYFIVAIVTTQLIGGHGLLQFRPNGQVIVTPYVSNMQSVSVSVTFPLD